MLLSVLLLPSASRPLLRLGFENSRALRNLHFVFKHRQCSKVQFSKEKIQHCCNSFSILFQPRNSSRNTLSLLTGLTGYSLLKFGAPFQTASCASQDLQKSPQPVFDWKKFFELIWPDFSSIFGAVIAALVAAVMNIQLPIYLGDVINVMTRFMNTEGRGNFSGEMQGPVFNLLGIYIGQALATFSYIFLLSNVGERLATRMKCLLYSSILRQDLEFFDKHRTGDLVDCITSDVQEFKSAFKLVVSQGLRSVTQIGGCMVSMYLVSPTMTAGMLVVVPAVVVAGTAVGALLRAVSRAAQLQAAVVTTLSEETVSNIRTVRAFATEDLETERFQHQLIQAQTLYQRLGLGIAMFQAGTNLFLNGLVLATLYAGGYLVAAQELNPGSLMSFLVATQTIQRSLSQLSLLFGNYVRGMQAASRAFQYINTEEKIPLSGGQKIPLKSLEAIVEFNNVTFSYPTRPQQVILKAFNLTLPAGKTVAIVGTSGNGKSTIAALLERFYDVNGGSILVGGVDIRELDPSWLRGQVIGIINQEPVLFATTILENIRYGRPTATDKQVMDAARLANADQFIRQFPEGYDTVLGERGVTVSGGQKQRIAIARALLKDPAILILDEATSALDTESEQVVQQALEVASKDRTVLVIAHRLSTIQHADIIVVLSAGRVVETGNHTSLMSKKGHYYNLMNQQNITDRAAG